MALIKCQECNKEISDKAASCPSCGCPIAGNPTEIEATGKEWKSIQLFSVLGVIFGMIIFFVGAAKSSNGAMGFGVICFLGGLIGFMIGRIGAWWHHG